MLPDTIQLIPLDQINPEALTRDRIANDPVAMEELQNSILANGLRMPIEVFELEPGNGNLPYALVSGFRRLSAFRELSATLGQAKFSEIPAIIRYPESITSAYTAMVEENAVRSEISAYERGRIAVIAVEKGLFDSLDAAIAGLYPTSNPVKRSRIRSLAELTEELDGSLTAPELLSQRQALRIVAALRANFGDVIRTALSQTKDRAPELQWQILLPILLEAEHEHRNPPPVQRPGYPKRVIRPHPGVTTRREMTRNGWILHITGHEARGMMINTVMETIEMMYAPR